MPFEEDVLPNLIDEIRNKMGYKVYIFTWRDWIVLNDNKRNYIERITKAWLKDNNVTCDKIKFEKGNYNRPIRTFSSKYRTRYYYSAKYCIKYFVEDSLDNARRLSHICEYVFLINHKYNKIIDNYDIPYNIIRVNSWRDILDWIKRLN